MSNRPAFRVAVTLVEITLGLAIAAIVVFASIRAYYYSRENALYQQTVEMIGTVRGAIGARYGMTSDYSTVAPNKIIVSLPQSIVNPAGTSLVTPFRGDASVGPDTAARLGDSFYISLNNLPSDACSRLTRSDFGRDAIAMRIDASNAIGPVNATKVMNWYIYEQAFSRFNMGYATTISIILFAILIFVSMVQMRIMRAGESDM